MSHPETAEKKGAGPKSILPPDMDYEYFAGAARYPFEPENHRYSSINSWWLAEASHLSYCHPGFSRLACRVAGFHSFEAVSGKKAFCIAAWNDAFCLVAFRGTQLRSSAALRDLYTDLNAKPVPHPAGGKVHRGFLRAFEEIEPELALLLTALRIEHPGIKIWVTGHSLGGALAALLYSRIPDCEGLYLFGAPRVGDAEFSEIFAGKPVFRIERVKDPIPRLPLDVSKLGFDFKDLGTLIMIRGDRSLEKERPKFDRQLIIKQMSGTQVQKLNAAKRLHTEVRHNFGDLETVREAVSETKQELRRISEEWRAFASGIFRDYPFEITAHMPIHYCTDLRSMRGKMENQS